MVVNIFINVLAACSMIFGCYYLVLDIRYGIREVIRLKISMTRSMKFVRRGIDC